MIKSILPFEPLCLAQRKTHRNHCFRISDKTVNTINRMELGKCTGIAGKGYPVLIAFTEVCFLMAGVLSYHIGLIALFEVFVGHHMPNQFHFCWVKPNFTKHI